MEERSARPNELELGAIGSDGLAIDAELASIEPAKLGGAASECSVSKANGPRVRLRPWGRTRLMMGVLSDWTGRPV